MLVTETSVDRPAQEPHMLNVSSLLLSAEHRRLSKGADADLLECVLLEMVETLEADYIVLWELVSTEQPRAVWRFGGGNEKTSSPLHVACGVVKQIRLHESPSGVCFWKYLTACMIAEGHQLVLEISIPFRVPEHQDLVDFCEVLADLFRRKLVSALAKNSQHERDLLHVLTLLHSDLDSVRVANCICSDATELLRCCRISVARRRNTSSWELVASTAVGQPDLRADGSQAICRVIAEAASQVQTSAGKELERQSCLRNPDKAGAHLVVPLNLSEDWPTTEWAAVFEWEAEQAPEPDDRYFATICRHAALAFRNATGAGRTASGNLLFHWRQSLLSRQMIPMAILASVSIACLVFLPMELRIEVAGKLIPTNRSFVFAPEDGVIKEVFVEDGSLVASDTVLCQIRNEDLEIQLEAIEGEVAAVTSRLAALESLRGDRNLSQSGLLSAEYAELKERLTSFEKRANILNDRIRRLALTASTPGKVYGDRLQELLRGRPVQRGQYLFELADPESGWQLDFRIPERDARHVFQAEMESKAPLTVTYSLETEPDRTIETTLSRVSASTDVDEYGRLSTLATSIPEPSHIRNPRPGAGMVGYIHCGKYSAGYVLFRRIIEAFQRSWWL